MWAGRGGVGWCGPGVDYARLVDFSCMAHSISRFTSAPYCANLASHQDRGRSIVCLLASASLSADACMLHMYCHKKLSLSREGVSAAGKLQILISQTAAASRRCFDSKFCSTGTNKLARMLSYF